MDAFCLVPAFVSLLAVAVPDFTPGRHAYVVPETLDLPLDQTEAAAQAAEHDVWILVFEEVADGGIEGGHASETEDAIEAVHAAWGAASPLEGRPHAYDMQEDLLVVVSLDEREVRVLPGTKLDRELGLHTEEIGRASCRERV